MSEKVEMNATNLQAHASQVAATDDTFRAELLANPRAAVEKLFNFELPARVTIKAIEEEPDTYIVVVPAKVNVSADGELSDSDLEAVAGGSKAGAKSFFTKVGSGLAIGGFAPMAFADGLSSFTDPVKKAKALTDEATNMCNL